MKNLNCKNCGADIRFDVSAMTAVCHYCGTKYVLSRDDTDYFYDFYNQMKDFLALNNNEKKRREKADSIWNKTEESVFECSDGRKIEIKYMYCFNADSCKVYTARRNIIFYFDKYNSYKAEKFRKTVSFIDYPSADIRKLSDFFPKVTGGFKLTDGSTILVISKSEDEYPLSLFGNLSGRHVSWIISRMENLCCVLEYNSLVHPEISEDTLYINPYTHQASLYGGWWKVGKKNSIFENGKTILQIQQNLFGIRNTAARLLGFDFAKEVYKKNDIPEALVKFIKSYPESNAYDDFTLWDKMLIEAYGERRFIRFNTDDEKIYR